MVTLDIHFENFEQRHFGVIEKLAKKGPISISIAPWQVNLIKEYQIKKIREILSNKNHVLGQQGLTHKCDKCTKYYYGGSKLYGLDPWHENYCLWFGKVPANKQEAFMREGRKILYKTFGKEPELYVPPNHYFDATTVKIAARIGYKWFTDDAQRPLVPYRLYKITIIPESYPNLKGNKQIYFHNDQVERFKEDIRKLMTLKFESMHSIIPNTINVNKIEENRKLKMIKKIARDLRDGFGASAEKARDLAQILFETKFSGDAFK